MSEVEFVEPTSDSFWEIGQFKRTVKRAEDGYKMCNDLMQMIAERADIEKQYSKNLKSWSKKWNDYLIKGNEYGSMKNTWFSVLAEADKMAEIHLTTNNVLIDELNREIKDWQKQNYQKTIVNHLKITKEYEEEFKKAQKPWAKKYEVVQKTKKDYHSACKSYQSAKVQCVNSQNDPTISADQKKKFEDKVEKYKKEVEVSKNKYKQALEELNSYNSRYIEDMNNVYKKCDSFEKERLEFFIQKFSKLHDHLNIYEKMNVEAIYAEFLQTIRQTNPDKDLCLWSKDFGSGMAMNWPVFEEYSEELKNIARGNRASKITKDINPDSNGGVTMTSIKHKTDEFNDAVETRSMTNSVNEAGSYNRYKSQTEDPWADSPSYSSQRSNEFVNSFDEQNQHNNWTIDSKTNSNNSKESNPFGENDDDDETKTHVNGTKSKPNNQDSDEEDGPTYLNIKVKALYDYQSAEDDELSFKTGEEFTKLANEDERGWCLGKIGNKIGLYPATYAINV